MLGSDQQGHPAAAATSVPGDQVAHLAVLRREQDDADRGPGVQALLKALSAREAAGVHVDGVRLLAERPDGTSALVPMERSGSHDPGHASTVQPDVLCVLYGVRAASSAVGQKCGTTADLLSGKLLSANAGSDGRMHLGGLRTTWLDLHHRPVAARSAVSARSARK